jgi:hypothetical protein
VDAVEALGEASAGNDAEPLRERIVVDRAMTS